MRILITNDDGIHGEGLVILEQIARTLTDDVWVVASELDQSGASHSLTLREPLRIRKIADKKFAISGTPTDCVLVACAHLMKDKKPDFVFSGVNYGANMAEDVTYSGTIAAAMEGALLGIPSVAFSMNIQHLQPAKWETALKYGPEIVKKLTELKLDENVLLNVNFPDCAPEDVKGIRATVQSHRTGSDNLIECKDPRGKPYYWIGAAMYRYAPDPASLENGSDLQAVYDQHISITPITLNLTHFDSLSKIKTVFC